MSADSPPAESGSESEPEPEPQNGSSFDPLDPRHRVTTYVYDGRARLTEIHGPEELGGRTVYPYDPPAPFSFEWEHLPNKRLYALTAEGKTEHWRDNPTRYLVVEPDAETGMVKPALKHGRPVYLWLCREEREGR